MSKQSSYQKLKARNLELELEIRTLITQSGTFAALVIKAKKEMQYGMTDMLLFGNRDSDLRTGGIIQFIKESSEGKHPPEKGKITLMTFNFWKSLIKKS